MNNYTRLLEVFLKDSYKGYHIRELARLLKLNPNTIINLSEDLIKRSMITKEREVNRVILKADMNNPIFKIKKRCYNVETIYSSGLISHLNEELAFPTIILFGSCAKAENRPDSDIDLFVLCDNKKELSLEKFRDILEKEIQVFLYTKKDYENLSKNSPELLNNIINGVVLEGYIEVY